jgi:hypothetical protein
MQQRGFNLPLGFKKRLRKNVLRKLLTADLEEHHQYASVLAKQLGRAKVIDLAITY